MATYLERRRARVAAAWNLNGEVVLVGAGRPIPIPGGADQTFPFVAHSDYFYLADRQIAGGVIAFDPKEGWVDFVPEVTAAERIWEGKADALGTPMSKLESWLGARHDRPVIVLGCAVAGVPGHDGRASELSQVLLHTRRVKDEVELERMRAAAAATAPGFAAARQMIRAGVTERQIQIELEAEFFRHGGSHLGYDTIVAAGSNSAVLHFAPTSRTVREGDGVLIDAGAAVSRYVSDVTRTYRAPGGDDRFFRDLFAIVLAVEQRAITRCTPGREWQDVHFEAALGIAEGLVGLGLMKGDPQTLVETDAHALFFPHGIGHLVGLGVRDASGRAPGRAPSQRPGLSNLRVDLPLERGYAITVEPGVYFIPALLNNPENRVKYRDIVAWNRVERLLDFGGIRIEDNVIVTQDRPEVLTKAIPTGWE